METVATHKIPARLTKTLETQLPEYRVLWVGQQHVLFHAKWIIALLLLGGGCIAFARWWMQHVPDIAAAVADSYWWINAIAYWLTTHMMGIYIIAAGCIALAIALVLATVHTCYVLTTSHVVVTGKIWQRMFRAYPLADIEKVTVSQCSDNNTGNVTLHLTASSAEMPRRCCTLYAIGKAPQVVETIEQAIINNNAPKQGNKKDEK
ncbi:MAG: hypothetical protein MK052_12055 [Alphaproteobacteria bacterium]|nr:hypothetical protein [Alphaproteobacteria bacterium]